MLTDILKKIFAPVLKPFESGDGPYHYKSSNRTILKAVGCLFWLLSTGVLFSAPKSDLGFLIPVCIFFVGGMVRLVVGFLGSDRAVAKIWGGK